MELIRLVIRNLFRHRLRAGLTLLGVIIAMLSFGILRTLVDAWYVGVESASPNRLITRNKISLIYALPIAYRNKIQQIPGVTAVAYGRWYGGIYKDKKNFFAQFAISGMDYLNQYPEYLISESEKRAFERERNAAIAGRRLVERFGWKIGDVIPLQGTIYPGSVELVLKGTYRGATRNVDETSFLFRYDYLNEQLRKTAPNRADTTGWFLVKVKDADRAAEIAQEIDKLFDNSLAETLTETEKAFQMGFVAMTDAILIAIQFISVLVIGIILLVLANTMAMTARERSSEYAVLKSMGFRARHIMFLIAGESMAIASIGGLLGASLTIPGGVVFQAQLESFLPVFEVSWETLIAILVISMLVGLAAALIPAIRIARMPIAEGLQHVG